jgi:putative acetyltransferase
MTTIRPETAADHKAVRRVHCLAFRRDDEARLVDALRAGDYARLSLVAEAAGEVVGHILFSDLPIVTDKGTVAALALAPLAVVPEFQNRGIGSALVRGGLHACRDQGQRIVIVLGHPCYYPRFGFSPGPAARLESPFSGPSFMALELVPGALHGVSGKVVYPPPFGPGSQGSPVGPMSLILLPGTFAVCRLDGNAVPAWATAGEFYSVTRTAEELSVVSREDAVPPGVRCERSWRCLRVAGTLPFSAVGVLAALTAPLAAAGISVFVVSTFDTDYLMVKQEKLEAALAVLAQLPGVPMPA